MPLLRFDMTSSRLLLLHVDRGLKRHGYPWVPIDLPEDPSTCQWALPKLTCGPKDMKTTWSARQDSPDNLRQFG
jgi:hypothetical protein